MIFRLRYIVSKLAFSIELLLTSYHLGFQAAANFIGML